MKAKLVLTSKDRQTAQEVPFDRPSITIGRKPNNDLAFNRPEISGSHAAFLFENDQYFVMDLGSTNGTLLNGAQLVAREKYGLQDRDVITVAPYTIQFVIEDISMETMIEVPSQPAPPKVMRSGTSPDLGAKMGTGTEENIRQQNASAPPPAAPKPGPLAEAPAAPKPEPSAPAPAPAVPASSPAASAVAPLANVSAPQAAKRPSALTDYIWLGIGAILVLAAIGLIIFILVGL